MKEEQIQEASWTVQSVLGASAYMHGIDYSTERFKEELNQAVQHLKETARVPEFA